MTLQSKNEDKEILNAIKVATQSEQMILLKGLPLKFDVKEITQLSQVLSYSNLCLETPENYDFKMKEETEDDVVLHNNVCVATTFDDEDVRLVF